MTNKTTAKSLGFFQYYFLLRHDPSSFTLRFGGRMPLFLHLFLLYNRYIHTSFIHKHSLRPISTCHENCYDDVKMHFSLLPGSPITNKVCIASQHGEIYGLDHDIQRFQPLTVAQLRWARNIMLLAVLHCQVHVGA